MCVFLLFKQKTAYELRISDWSSDVCSSDLFAVGLRREAMPLALQLAAQDLVVLDNAVVDQRDAIVGMGMRIGFARRAVGRPAGMADADRSEERRVVTEGVSTCRSGG